MDKDKLEIHYNALNEMLDEFTIGHSEYKYGSNKKKRDAGERKLDSVLLRFEMYVKKDYNLYEFLTSENGSGIGAAFYWDELRSFRYFGRDMPSHLARLKSELEK